MTDSQYKELVEAVGEEHANALRKLTHSGDAKDLQEWLRLRQVKK